MNSESKDTIKRIAEVAQYIYSNSSKSILECIEIAKQLTPERVAALKSGRAIKETFNNILTEEKELENGEC